MNSKVEEEYQNGIKALQEGDFVAAEESFRTSTVLDPDHYESWNLLGLTYQFMKKWTTCMQVWKQALRCRPDSTDTMLNLGIACIAAERPKEAENFWNSILETEPENIRCLINLGLFYREREVNQRAHDMWEKAFHLMPENANVQEWLADVKGVLGMQKIIHQQWEEAEDFLIEAVSLDPEYAVLWGYLSELHFQKQEFQKAFATCSKGLNLEPENATLHHTMGNILRMTQQEDQALIAYQKSLECGSKHPATYRAIAELSQSEVDEDEQVIQLLFDQYADHFDKDLLENLAYATPKKSHELCTKHKDKETFSSVLDLGCGTGLSLLPFIEHCSKEALLVGVDLSAKMLEVAEKKSLYTELHCDSIKEYMDKEKRIFELILCLDTLVYLRQLEGLFSSIREQVSDDGYFLFSTETTKANEPTLQRSGRYAHPQSYIQQMIDSQGWNCVAKKESLLRKDGEHWIEGMIWMIQRSKTL
jgi:predicted TPR repeat methyltransferase